MSDLALIVIALFIAAAAFIAGCLHTEIKLLSEASEPKRSGNDNDHANIIPLCLSAARRGNRSNNEKLSLTDIASIICNQNADSVKQVEDNQLKLIYGLLWHDRTLLTGSSRAAWQLVKSYLTHDERAFGISAARKLIERSAAP